MHLESWLVWAATSLDFLGKYPNFLDGSGVGSWKSVVVIFLFSSYFFIVEVLDNLNQEIIVWLSFCCLISTSSLTIIGKVSD